MFKKDDAKREIGQNEQEMRVLEREAESLKQIIRDAERKLDKNQSDIRVLKGEIGRLEREIARTEDDKKHTEKPQEKGSAHSGIY